jgi:PEP-CTERM motif-containing protein
MRAARFIAILGVVFLASGVSVARAGTISTASFSGFSGPGCDPTCTGTGFSGVVTNVAANNDALADTNPSSNTLRILDKFTNPTLGYIDATFTVTGSGGVTEYWGNNISVTNNTGVTWSTFQWSLIPGNQNDGLDFDYGVATAFPVPTASKFSILNQNGEDIIDWSGISGVVNGTSVIFTFSIDVPDTYTSFILRGTPNFSPNNGAVPEPASLLLLGSGMAGLGLWRRRHA